MKKTFSGFGVAIILSFSFLCINSCSNRADTVSCFPNSPINVTLNLNLPAYYDLQNVGGWKYIDEQQCGTRGLIVVNTTSGFKAYDRNAPHICPDTNTTLEVKDNIKIICAKDNAEWQLMTGQPSNIANVPPKTYPVTFNAGTNSISIYY